jgi:hypothetical protein
MQNRVSMVMLPMVLKFKKRAPSTPTGLLGLFNKCRIATPTNIEKNTKNHVFSRILLFYRFFGVSYTSHVSHKPPLKPLMFFLSIPSIFRGLCLEGDRLEPGHQPNAWQRKFASHMWRFPKMAPQ